MSRLIDADALRKPIYAEEDNITGSGMTYAEMDGYNDGIDTAWSRIDNAPTVDAGPVVRCKDCKHRGTDDCPMHRKGVPTDEDFLKKVDNDFCSYGERKEE